MSITDHAAKGGKARAERLSPADRSASAAAAARARWQKTATPAPTRSPPTPPDPPLFPDTDSSSDCDPHMGYN
jgi:hypothetical protein